MPGWGSVYFTEKIGWSHTLYDSLSITTWALLIVGLLLVTIGLINYARR